MEHQTPLREDSEVFKILKTEAEIIRLNIDSPRYIMGQLECTHEVRKITFSQINDFRESLIITLNDLEKSLSILTQHRERYEAQQELDEQLKRQAHGEAFRYGSPIEE